MKLFTKKEVVEKEPICYHPHWVKIKVDLSSEEVEKYETIYQKKINDHYNKLDFMCAKCGKTKRDLSNSIRQSISTYETVKAVVDKNGLVMEMPFQIY